MRIVLFLAVATFVAGLVRLVSLRFEYGDALPPYSSLRADPIGTKVLYESLGALDGVSVRRHFGLMPEHAAEVEQAYGVDPNDAPMTLFCLGENVRRLDGRPPETRFIAFESVARAGGRVVISFQPAYEDSHEFEEYIEEMREGLEEEEEDEELDSAEAAETAGSDGGDEDVDDVDSVDGVDTEEDAEGDTEEGTEEEDKDDFRPSYAPKLVSIKDRWGVSLAYRDVSADDYGAYEPGHMYRVVKGGLPDEITCTTGLYFEVHDEAWRVIYDGLSLSKQGEPLLIERDFGTGSIVLCADSYLFSNEAMLDERHPALLAWLAAPVRPHLEDAAGPAELIFDETHLGIIQREGVMSLARKYRLYGVMAGILVLAGLFVWKNGVPFVPPHADELPALAGGLAAGKAAAAGLENLLRRSIGRGNLLAVCLEEWRKTQGGASKPDRVLEEKIGRLRALAAPEAASWDPRTVDDGELVGRYQKMCEEVVKDDYMRKSHETTS